jgi:fibronectin-binding autotransporter adhesin
MHAQTDSWIGSSTGSLLWSDGSNWSLGAAPHGSDNVVISDNDSYFVNGNVTLTSNSTYTGSTDLLSFDGINPSELSVQGNSGALSGTSSVVIGWLATLTLGDTGTTVADPDRLNHAASIELNGGQLTLISSSYAGITSQQAGQLLLDSGQSRLILQQANAGAQTELLMTGVTAAPGAVLWVSATNLGQASGTANTSRILFSTAPTMIGGGGAAGTTNISIVPYIVGAGSTDPSASSLMTYNSVTGLRPLNTATEYAADLATAGSTDNVRLVAAASLGTSKTVNSLTLVYNDASSYTLDLGANNTLTITSGVLFSAAQNEYSGGGPNIVNGTISLGSQTGYIQGLNISSVITGTGGLTISGGIAGGSLGGANTYSGVTYLNSGTVAINNSAGLGATGSGNGTVINGGGLVIASGLSIGEDILFAADDISYGIKFAGNNQMNGTLTVAAGAANVNVSGSTTINGAITTSGAGTHAIVFSTTSGTLTLNGNISDGDGPLTLSLEQAGAVILAGNNTYSGGTIIQLDSTVQVTSATGLGTGYVYDGYEDSLTFNFAGNATISNEIDGLGSVIKNGSNTIALAGNSSYTGGTFLNSGTIQISADANLGSSESAVMMSGGSLEVTGTNNSVTTARSFLNGGSFIVDSGDTYTISGAVSGTGSLMLGGTGTLVLSGQNTYTGSTHVFGGTLYADTPVNSGYSSTGTGPVVVQRGGTLSGNGVIRPAGMNGVIIASGGVLAPGGVQPASGAYAYAAGALTLDSSATTGGILLTLDAASGSTPAAGLTFNLGAALTSSYINITGSDNIVAFLNGTSDPLISIIDLTAGHLTLGHEYILFHGSGSTSYVGLHLGASTSLGQEILGNIALAPDFTEEYAGSELFLINDNIDVYVIPEPRIRAMLLLGIAALSFRFRRERPALAVAGR